MNALQQPPPRPMRISEFLEWAGSADGRWQLRDGEPEPVDPASNRHSGLQAEMSYLLAAHLRMVGGPYRVAVTPGVIPHLRADRNMLIPDIAVASAPFSAEQGLREPIVLIEILSPSNEARTRANVWAYATIPSVSEILLVSSLDIAAEILRRRPDGGWPEVPETVGRDGRLTIERIGFDAPLIDVYATTDLV